jgi:hypothetical protein
VTSITRMPSNGRVIAVSLSTCLCSAGAGSDGWRSRLAITHLQADE